MSSARVANFLTLSIVSHGHGKMVWNLVEQLSELENVSQIIVTLNITEQVPDQLPNCVEIIHNSSPQGFGKNHNQAFSRCVTKYFGVINPDISLITNPFPELIKTLDDERIGIAGPQAINIDGVPEDNLRWFPTPINLLRRYCIASHQENFLVYQNLVLPDWFAGMFMLFRASDFRHLNGFDEGYFMYCEDTDICTRLWLLGKCVAVNSNTHVIHQARRASRSSIRHFLWHINSLFRYWATYFGRLPSPSLMVAQLGLRNIDKRY